MVPGFLRWSKMCRPCTVAQCKDLSDNRHMAIRFGDGSRVWVVQDFATIHTIRPSTIYPVFVVGIQGFQGLFRWTHRLSAGPSSAAPGAPAPASPARPAAPSAAPGTRMQIHSQDPDPVTREAASFAGQAMGLQLFLGKFTKGHAASLVFSGGGGFSKWQIPFGTVVKSIPFGIREKLISSGDILNSMRCSFSCWHRPAALAKPRGPS